MTDPNPVLEGVLADLAALTQRLDDRVADLPDDATGWRRPTPAAGWDVAAQVAHLAWTDIAAATAARAVRGERDGGGRRAGRRPARALARLPRRPRRRAP